MRLASEITTLALEQRHMSSDGQHRTTDAQIVWVHGCLTCGQLNLASFWGSPTVAKLAEQRCRHCLSTEMAVCPVELPRNGYH